MNDGIYSLKDTQRIADLLQKHGAINLEYSDDNQIRLELFICYSFVVMGKFGGNPKGHLFLAVYGHGAFHFDATKYVSVSYLIDKLGVCSRAATQISDLIREIGRHLYPEKQYKVLPTTLPENLYLSDGIEVLVCASCKRASCWKGFFYCEDYKTASTLIMTIKELKELNLENPEHWLK